MVVQSLIMDKHQLKSSLAKLFQKMDDDQSGKEWHILSLQRLEPKSEVTRILVTSCDFSEEIVV